MADIVATPAPNLPGASRAFHPNSALLAYARVTIGDHALVPAGATAWTFIPELPSVTELYAKDKGAVVLQGLLIAMAGGPEWFWDILPIHPQTAWIETASLTPGTIYWY